MLTEIAIFVSGMIVGAVVLLCVAAAVADRDSADWTGEDLL